jgi:hypothetical protein
MFKSLRYLCLLAALGLLSFAGWCADKKQSDPGGKGVLESSWYLNECFRTASGTVTEVCGKYKINWKLWTLMGEPVGDYNVAWKLTSLKLMDPKRKLVNSFTSDELPAELKKSASTIELLIDAFATVNAGRTSVVYHRFNTGVAVRAGVGSSFNVPGSSSWDTFFAEGNQPCETTQGVFIGGQGANKQNTSLDAKTAKKLFIEGIQLTDLRICTSSGFSELSWLESAISKLCEKPGADKRYQFCPKVDEKPKKEEPEASASLKNMDASADKGKNNQPESNPGLGASAALDGAASTSAVDVHSLLDEKAERPAIQKRLSQEVAAYRRTTEPGCQNTMRDIDACYVKTGCKRPASSPSIEECRSIPSYPGGGHCNPFCLTKVPGPGEACYREDAECRAARAEREREKIKEAAELEDRKSQWTSSYGALNRECQARSKERNEFANCQKQYDASCNPKRFNSTDDCVSEQVISKGPTEKDARKLMQKDWEQRSKTGLSITNSILD